MRTILALGASCALVAACSQTETPSRDVPYSVAIAAIQKAQDDAERIHLNDKLQAAETNLGRLKVVYEDATRLGATIIAAEADKRIAAIVIPRVTTYRSPAVIKKYLKKVPEGSETEKKLFQLLDEQPSRGR